MADLSLASIEFFDAVVYDSQQGAVGLAERVEYIDYGATSAVGDLTPPVVSIVSPVNLQLEENTQIVVDVTDNVAIRKAILAARFPSLGLHEVVAVGTEFAARFSGSSQVSISGGTRYTLRRNGGWPAAPTLEVYAFDTSGQES